MLAENNDKQKVTIKSLFRRNAHKNGRAKKLPDDSVPHLVLRVSVTGQGPPRQTYKGDTNNQKYKYIRP